MVLVARLSRLEEVLQDVPRGSLVEVPDEVDDEAVLLHARPVAEARHVAQDGQTLVELVRRR